MLQFGFNFFVFFSVFSFGNDIFDILLGFPASIFFLPYQVCKQFVLSFQTLQTIFFNISHPPSTKIRVRPLLDLSGTPGG